MIAYDDTTLVMHKQVSVVVCISYETAIESHLIAPTCTHSWSHTR